MVLFLLIGSFEKVDQPTPPPKKKYLTPHMKIKHPLLIEIFATLKTTRQPLSNQKFQGLTHNAAKWTAELPYNETKYSLWKSFDFNDWKIMKIYICFINQKMKMEVFEWVDLKRSRPSLYLLIKKNRLWNLFSESRK